MNKITAIFALAAATFTVAACVQSTDKKAARSNKDAAPEKEMECGAYSQWREVSAEEMKIYRNALDIFLADKEVCDENGCSLPEEYIALDEAVPTAVSSQVVAGTNYKFRSDVALVTVFLPLPGRGDPQVSSVEMTK